MSKTHCQHCEVFFTIRPQTPDQRFCSIPACQRERKRRWQALKRQTDDDYRASQTASARPEGYWKDYRQRNVEGTRRNREQQKIRDDRRRTRPQSDLATEDASTPGTPTKSTTYGVILLPRKVLQQKTCRLVIPQIEWALEENFLNLATEDLIACEVRVT